MEKVIAQTVNLVSDEVAKLKIIEILEAETSAAQFESIMKATKIDPISLSTQGDTLINALNDVPLSIHGNTNYT